MDKRFWLASLAAFVVQFVGVFIINVFFLMEAWISSAGNILRYWDNAPAGSLSELEIYHFMVIPFILWSIAMVWLYRRGVQDKPWVQQGAVFGALFSFATVIPMRIHAYATYNFSDGSKFVPSPVLIQEMVMWTLVLVMSGIVIAWFYRKPA